MNFPLQGTCVSPHLPYWALFQSFHTRSSVSATGTPLHLVSYSTIYCVDPWLDLPRRGPEGRGHWTPQPGLRAQQKASHRLKTPGFKDQCEFYIFFHTYSIHVRLIVKNALNGLLAKLLNYPLSKPLGGIQPPLPQKLCSCCPMAVVCQGPSSSLSGMEASSTLGKASGQAAFPDLGAAFGKEGGIKSQE